MVPKALVLKQVKELEISFAEHSKITFYLATIVR